MQTPTLNDVEALDQLRAYPQDVRDLYRTYRQRGMTEDESLRKILQDEAEGNIELEKIGIYTDGRG